MVFFSPAHREIGVILAVQPRSPLSPSLVVPMGYKRPVTHTCCCNSTRSSAPRGRSRGWSSLADIFDHVFAIVPAFGLRVFQSPSGADLGRLAQAFDK